MGFENAGQSAGLSIWRIEDFSPVEYDQSKYGKFHIGDSYIVLKTKESGGVLSWDIHFWIGSETSQDESGSAAILSVELDDQLGGGPIQHREVQEHESDLFLSYFKSGVRYLPGGVVSGFTHYDPEEVEKRLFRVKGKRNVQVMEVPISVSSLNKSDCFILDLGKNHSILILMPPGSRRMEQFRANQVASEIRDEDHAGNAEIEIIDQDFDKFFEALGEGSYDEIPENDDNDESSDALAKKTIKLYKIEDEDVSIVSDAPLKQEMLESDNAFIVYGGTSGLFIWIGKESYIVQEASNVEKAKVFQVAEKLIADNNLPKNTKVTKLVEGIETAMFKQFFTHWNETENENAGFGRKYNPGAIAEWDITDLHFETRKRIARSAGGAIGFMPDNGNGSKKVWRIEDMDLVEVPEDKASFLYSGDCYVILYTGEDGKNIVYFWQGNKCSIDEKGASAIHAARIDNEDLGGKAMQIRVVQGKEPRHFIKMFGGNLLVLKGGKGSGFKNVHQDDDNDDDPIKLFRVQSATGDNDARAMQVTVEDGVYSDDAYILASPDNLVIWSGVQRENMQEETDQAKRIAKGMFEDRESIETMRDGENEDLFWTTLGVDAESVLKSSDDAFNKPVLDPRLFHITPKRVFEIFNFQKSDLVTEDVMFLDSGDEVYVWIGAKADEEERSEGLEMAKKYLDADPTYRNADNCIVIVVKENEEPSSFTSIFNDW